MHEGLTSLVGEIGVVLMVAAGCAILARFLRLPLITGYITAGVIIGPLLHYMGEATAMLDISKHLAFTFLLFLVGLETDWLKTKAQLKTGFVVAFLQMVGSFLLGFALAYFFNLELSHALLLSLALTFSSGVVAVKLLAERQDLSSLHGRLSASILLVQDLFAVLALILLSGYATPTSLSLPEQSVFLIMKGVAVVTLFWFTSRFFLPKLFKYVAHSSELLLLTSVAWCFAGTAALQFLNIPLEAGALLAGLSLASLPFSFEILSKIRSFRDFFLILFFITVGASLVVPEPAYVTLTAVLVGIALIGRPILSHIILTLSGYRTRTAFFTSLTQGSLSEYGFIFIVLGATFLGLPSQLISAIAITTLVSIFISSILFTHRQTLYHWFHPLLRLTERGHHRHQALIVGETEISTLHDHVIIFGYHRMGYHILKQTQALHQDALVIDFNPEAIALLREAHIPALYGDVEDEQVFHAANVRKAALLVSTIPHREETEFLLTTVRQLNKHIPIIVTARTTEDAVHYYSLGATYVLLPHLLGSQHIASLITEHTEGTLLTTAARTEKQLKQFHEKKSDLFYD